MPARSEVIGSKPHWLLDLELGGAVYRLADQALEVNQADGTVLRYHVAANLGRLRVTLDDSPLSVAIKLGGVAPGGTPWALIIARGGPGALTGASATLRRWFEDQDFERARVMVAGLVTSPEYGTSEQPFEFSLERLGDEVLGTIPPEDAKIDETTWPVQDPAAGAEVAQPDPACRGAYYPWIFGVPGDGAEGLLWGNFPLSASSTPVYIGSWYRWETYIYSEFIVAGHEVLATTVRIDDVSGGYSRQDIPYENFTLTTDVDLRGRTVAIAKISTRYIVRIVPGNEYWATWSSGFGGGLPNSDRSAPMRNAGEVIEYMLRFVGWKVDSGRMAAVRTYLDRFHLDFCLAEPIRPREWISQELGSLLPLVWRESEDGIYLDVLRYDATEQDAVLHLVEARDASDDPGVVVTRSTPLRGSEPARVENDFTIRYAVMRGGELLKRKRLAAPGVAGTEGVADTSVSGEFPAWLLGVSQRRHGVRPRTFSAWFVCEDTTADLLLATRARWKSIARRSLAARGGVELEQLEPGAVVTYSESRLYMTKEPALVRAVTFSLRSVDVALELLDDPGAP